MIPRRKFGHHAAIVLVEWYLAVETVRQQAVFRIEYGYACLIATGFYAENLQTTPRVW